MASITHCLKKLHPENWVWLLLAAVLLLGPAGGHAQADVGLPALQLERADDDLKLSAQLKFELPSVVEDALLKGIPIYFVAQVELRRQWLYWLTKKVVVVQRRMRLSYHPLTRRWRVNIASGEVLDAGPGVALNQNFESLAEAMSTIRRISHWKIADAAELEHGTRYFVEFKFSLDVSQLPRPLQIGTLGQSDWSIVQDAEQSFEMEPIK